MKEEFDALFAEHQKLLGELQAMRAVAKPEQEPVAWQDTAKPNELVSAEDWDNIDPMYQSFYRPLYTTPPQRTEQVCCQKYDTCLEPCTPRGEHLAQRTWVGLTHDERLEIRSRVQEYTPIDSVKYGEAIQYATEQALMEKNA